MKKLVVGLLDLYRILISPYIPTECRYYPTCSSYMKEAVIRKGVLKGIFLGVKRILRCHPFSPGGYDPLK